MTGERTKGFFAKEPRKQVPLVFVFSSGFRFMSSLSVRQRILIGFTLFAMFFGAGNLIFPPWLGAEAATSSFTGFLGFLTTAVVFPILGVMAVAESGGLKPLASRVGPRFAALFTLLIYLSIGPCLAIPRTAGTSFEMIGRPLAEATGILSTTYFGFEVLTLLQAAYSVLFFAAAFWVALDPDKLTARLGKFLCPTLLFLIALLWVGCLFNPAESASAPVGRYADNAFFAGFIDGYQTMDTLAALNFGLIIAMNIRAFGITADRAVVKETVLAGAMAAGLFFFVYGALVMLGTSAAALGTFENGAQLLSAAAGTFFGSAGTVVIGLVFFIACFNTCVGLIACCSDYFHSICPALSYRGWAFLFAVVSMVLSNAGLTLILKFSIPVLIAIYPVALVLIVLAFASLVRPALTSTVLYRLTVGVTGLVSVTTGIEAFGVTVPGLSHIVALLPGSAQGLAWVTPATTAIILGWLLTARFPAVHGRP